MTSQRVNFQLQQLLKVEQAGEVDILTWCLAVALERMITSLVLAVVRDSQAGGPQGSRQSVTVDSVGQVLLT